MKIRRGVALGTKNGKTEWQQKLSPFCLSMFLVSQIPLAACAQSAGSSYSGTSAPKGTFSSGTSATTSTGPVVPNNTIGALATPSQGSITPSMLSSLGSTVTNNAGQNLIIDVSTQATPGTVVYAGTFNNAGNTYLVSSNPAVTTATLQAASIYNQPGALITTILPSGGLPGFSNLISNLSLSLIATNFIANAGVISSAANLNVTAPQVVNALPAGVTAAAPVMSALNNLNIISPNITNAGLISSLNNINIATQVANNLMINNVGGVLSALNGAINVRDALFTGKYDFNLLGGDVLAKQLNVNNGDGIVHMQVNNLSPALNVIAGEGYISALSDIHVSTLQYSGDPILNSGGDIVFQGDQVPPNSGNYITTCTGSGTFSGVNAYIDAAHPCTLISTTGLVLNLSGNANLAGADISSGSGVSITAGSGITTGNISAPGGIILKTASGDISSGTLAASNSFVQVQADSGSISTGALTGSTGVMAVSGKSLVTPNIAVTRGGALDIYVNQSTPFSIGGAGANVGQLSLSGVTTTGGSFIHVKNSGAGGISINSAGAISISTPAQQSYLALDAGNGVLNLPAGTISLDSSNSFIPGGVIALSAGQINANGTILSASNTAGGYAGSIVMGANVINTGSGLTTHADGVFGYVGVAGYGTVTQTSTPAPPVDFLQVGFNGLTLLPITMQGQSFTATADGYQGQVIFNGSNMTLASGNITLTANGIGYGSSGYVQLYANQINNSANVLATANGVASDAGGLVFVRAGAPTSDLTVGQGKLAVFANGGPSGGDGGQIDISAGHTLSVDTGSIGSSALGGDGWGGRVTLVGGTQGQSGGGVVFTNKNAAINASGQGYGDGGLVQIGAFGNGSNLTLPSISANGGATGSGGWIDSTSNGKLIISAPLAADGGTDGSGGTVNLTAGLNSPGTISSNSTISANGAGVAPGGTISLTANGASADITVGDSNGQDFLEVNGATGGQVYLAAGRTLNVKAPVRALGTSGSGGFIQLDSGYEAVGDINIENFVTADRLAGTGTDGQVYVTSYNGNVKIGSSTANGHVSANGGTTVSIRSGLNSAIATGSVVSVDAVGTASPAGAVKITAGTAAPGTIDLSGAVHANATTGNGGTITLSQSSSSVSMLIIGTVAANSSSGQGGSITLTHSKSDLAVRLDGVLSATGVDSHSIGTVSINNSGRNVSISGNGEIAANISARTAQVSLTTTRPETILIPFDFDCTGAISLVASGATSRIDLPQGARLISTGTLSLQADSFKLGDGTNTNLPSLRGENVLLTQTHDGDLSLSCNITANQQLMVTLQGDGSIFQARESGVTPVGNLTAGNIVFFVNTGIIGTEAEKINLTADAISVQTGATAIASEAYFHVSPKTFDTVNVGNINLVAAHDVNGEPVGGHLVVASENATLRVSGLVLVEGDAVLTTVNHDILIGGSLFSGPILTLQCINSGSIVQSNPLAQLVGTNQMNLSADSITANTAVPNLSVFAHSGSATIRHTGNLTPSLTTVRDSFNLTVTNGSIMANALNAPIRAASLNITCTTGNVGEFIANTSLPVNVSTDNLVVNAPLGAVSIMNTKSSILTINSSESFGNLLIQSKGPVTTIGPLTSSHGGLALVSSGPLKISGIPFLTAGNGNLVLQNADSASGIEFDFGSRLHATGDSPTGGHITVFIGNAASQVDGSAPANFIAAAVNGGHIYWGNNVVRPGDSNTEQPNVLGADGRTITFSGPSNQQLIFHGGALLSAEGPSGSGATPGQGGQPPGQVRPSPGQTGQNPGLSGGASGPPGQDLYNPPGLISNPANPNPPGQSQTPPGQGKKGNLTPVAFVSGSRAAGLRIADLAKCTLMTVEGLTGFESNDEVKLNEGKGLLVASRPTLLRADDFTIDIPKGSVICIERYGKYKKIQNLAAGSCKVRKDDKHLLKLASGEEILIADDKHTLESLMGQSGARRRTEFQNCPLQETIAVSEISIPELLLNDKVFAYLSRSKIVTHRNVLSSILKTAVALNMVTASHGPYRQH